MSKRSNVSRTREKTGQGFFYRFTGRLANFVKACLYGPSYFVAGGFDTY